MRQVIPALVGLLIVVGVGLVQGYWTDRWHVGEKVERAVKSLESVPREVGDWTSEEQSPTDDRLGLAGQLYLRYVNRKTGDVIAIALVCGRPGPVSIHTPDVCYGTSGFKVSKRTEFILKDPGNKENPPAFFSADMSKMTASEQIQQRIYWTWRAGGRWQVSETPRKAFAGLPVLYKFYVLRNLTGPVPVDQDPCVDFLRQLLPQLEKVLDDGSV
jgi:hypothetical protein